MTKMSHTYDIANDTFMGMRFVASYSMTESVEDWSRVRSPARARRRMRRGFPQNVVVRIAPRKDILVLNGVAYVHPDTFARLKATVEKDNVRKYR